MKGIGTSTRTAVRVETEKVFSAFQAVPDNNGTEVTLYCSNCSEELKRSVPKLVFDKTADLVFCNKGCSKEFYGV